MRLFTTQRDRTRALAALALLATLLFAGSALFSQLLPSDPQAVRTWVLSFGPFAPLAFVALQALQVVVAPIPGQVLAFAGGYLFGSVWGTVFSVAGAAVGSVVVFALARRLGRPFVEDVLDPDVLSEFDSLVAGDGVVVLFLVFLVPGLPDDAICLLAGVTRVPIWQLTVVAILGRLPGYFLVAYAGAQAAADQFVTVGVVLGALALLSVVVYWRRDAVLEAVR
ncbi:TVP38/TMEM64 family protein [Halobacterium litoreum]|uniref:TVP38/TMEM64 family protein n=1 Tax=Halobacterium litoreum TaxID=2039234 RepID=A0ABD5NB60_9EURY|nr:TVP38/TMEM64 family protein [Halobacterium litoreum]UHH12108.1 TVP38/TMEM64 family protein [Halobacterium litoreum]